MYFKRMPDEGELVIATVLRINPNSVSLKLEEYDNLEGIIPVSELANTWVKDIRKFVKLDETIVVKVMPNYGKRDNYINLSYKRVKPTQKRAKINEWKNEKKARNYFRIAASTLNEDDNASYNKIGPILFQIFGNMYAVFEAASKGDAKFLVNQGIEEKWANAIVSVAVKNIKPKIYELKAIMTIKSFKSDGIDIIKKALSINNGNIQVNYISAPTYQIKVTGKSYKECEDMLESAANDIERSLKAESAEFELKK